MRLLDVYPSRGTFGTDEEIGILTEMAGELGERATIRIAIDHLTERMATLEQLVVAAAETATREFHWAPRSGRAHAGYGVEATLIGADGRLLGRQSTAFDVLPSWTGFPRYGFLTDFTPGRDDVEQTLDYLKRFHVNGIQFYDWQYRHDDLVPPGETFVDSLGRELSRRTLEQCLEAATRHGMASMAYLAVYGASLQFWGEHPQMALYDSSGNPLTFEGFLGLMDPSPGSDWVGHLRGECAEVLTTMNFDGLHIDQYGEPRNVFNHLGEPVDLPVAFRKFIALIRNDHPAAALVFNAVGNWPIDELAPSRQDFVYIEINETIPTYDAVREVLLGARRLSGGKAVVLAWYLPADRAANVRIADSLTFSLGGSRIELGEQGRLLTDPYFPHHQALPEALAGALRRYYDFAVRYGELIGPVAAIDSETPVRGAEGAWTIVRRSSGWLTICLVNGADSASPRWDQPQSDPPTLLNVALELGTTERIAGAYWASPDQADVGLAPVAWTAEGGTVRATIPSLSNWSILALQLTN